MSDNDSSSFWSASGKNLFVMGLIIGIGGSAILALFILLNGGKLSLAAGNPSAGNQPTAQAPDNNPSAAQPSAAQPTTQPVKSIEASDHMRGAKNAKVTLIEYSDFQCPFCKAFESTVAQALKDFPNDVKLVYRHFPLSSIHPYAEKAAEGAECATKLGGENAFWKFHDLAFTKSPDLGEDVLVSVAQQIGLSGSAFKTCLDASEMQAKVDASFASGNDAGVQGTPATFVNGKIISGAVPYDQLKSQIQAALK